MKYMGSKARIAKEILPIILDGREPDQWYVEPFAGGMNTICHVDGNRVGVDNNRYLIAMWIGLQDGKKYPTEISRDFYNDVRDSYNNFNYCYDNFTKGWVGYMASANGRFFEGGYSGISNTKAGTVRDYVAESVRNIEKQVPLMEGVHLFCSPYWNLTIPENSIIYCDPPYEGTKQYATSKGFDHKRFWEWVRAESRNHQVFVSEYSAPDDFECVWEKEVSSSLRANSEISGRKKSVEKLFKLK